MAYWTLSICTDCSAAILGSAEPLEHLGFKLDARPSEAKAGAVGVA